MSKVVIFFVLVIGPLAYFGLVFNKDKTNTPLSNDGGSSPYRAVWLWRSPTRLTLPEMSEIISNLEKDKFTDVYLDISEYADITDSREKTVASEKLKLFEKNVSIFIGLASASGIRVHALAGNETWSDPLYTYLPKRLLNYVIEYNHKAERGLVFSGIQFDIEFYGRDHLEDGARFVLKREAERYLRLVESLVDLTGESSKGLELGLAVPYWFDGKNGRMPAFDWQGKKSSMSNHLFGIMRNAPASYLVIMAYRNTALGENSTASLLSDIFKDSERISNQPGIVVGFLADKTKNINTSFFGKSKQKLWLEASVVEKKYIGYQSWRGISVHSYDSYTALNAD